MFVEERKSNQIKLRSASAGSQQGSKKRRKGKKGKKQPASRILSISKITLGKYIVLLEKEGFPRNEIQKIVAKYKNKEGMLRQDLTRNILQDIDRRLPIIKEDYSNENAGDTIR